MGSVNVGTMGTGGNSAGGLSVFGLKFFSFPLLRSLFFFISLMYSERLMMHLSSRPFPSFHLLFFLVRLTIIYQNCQSFANVAGSQFFFMI